MIENGEQQDICNLITMECVQRSLTLNEVTNDFDNMKVEVPEEVDGPTQNMLERCRVVCGRAAGTRAKMRSRVRKEASAQEVRGYYKQFAEAKHLEYKSWVDNEVFDLTNMRKVEPRNHVTGRHDAFHQDGQARQLSQSKRKMGVKRFPRQTKRILAD